MPVPEWAFTASCDLHDFQYWLGCREHDRARADAQFYQAMIRDTMRVSKWGRWWYRLMAWIYFKAVRRWGAEHFHFGPRERTSEDLDAALEGLA